MVVKDSEKSRYNNNNKPSEVRPMLPKAVKSSRTSAHNLDVDLQRCKANECVKSPRCSDGN